MASTTRRSKSWKSPTPAGTTRSEKYVRARISHRAEIARVHDDFDTRSLAARRMASVASVESLPQNVLAPVIRQALGENLAHGLAGILDVLLLVETGRYD